jgi:membrane-bound lytic murein transglycosylase B
MIELLTRGGNQLAERTIQDCVSADANVVEMKMGWDKGRPKGWADNNGRPTMSVIAEPFYVQKLEDWELTQLRNLNVI